MAGEDEVDLEALRQGDRAAWERFEARYSRVVLAAAARALAAAQRAQEAHDVAQDVFLRLAEDGYRLLKGYDPARASLATWLTVVARNRAIDLLRRRRPTTQPLDRRALEVAAPAAPFKEGLKVPAGLLTARQRLVLHLLFDKDLDPPEVAALIGVEVHTVRSTKHKAIARLRDHFAAAEEAGDAEAGAAVYRDEEKP
jgi:RNA polymerase sigma-70 factor (ECF subfamily)